MADVLPSVLSIASNLVAKIQRNPSSSSVDPHNCIEDLKKLERTLQRIQAVLHDAEEREIRDESVKLWLRELKDVAYDAEDVLDEYQYEVLRSEVEARAAATRKRKRVEEDQVCDLITSFSELKVSIPDGMVEKIREIGMRFDEIAKDRDALHLRHEDGERVFDFSKYPPPTSSHVDESGVVGRKRDKKKVMKLLFSDTDCKFSVIPIVGMGGLGKSTLAQLVYNDPRVHRYFDLTGWVCVSDDFDVPRLSRSIFQSITKKSCNLTELSAIHDALSDEVKGRSLLLVLDDVWNEKRSSWESLRVPFLSARMVRILVTTRNHSVVAKIMQTVLPYTLRGLPEGQCWVLFQRQAFGSENPKVAKDLVEIGEKIVKKCAGLPLAVKALGGLLRDETNRERWKEILESNLWELDQAEDEILPALRLSYQRLPACLKPCFAYCSLFPKDDEFDKGRMVRLWMAQGYIQPRGSRCLEDIGSDYFDELSRRSFFIVNHRKHFVMHDLMVDLSRSISREECCITTTMDDMMCGVHNKARHLYLGYGKVYKAVMKNLSSHHLRTFLHECRSLLCPCGDFFPSENFGYLRTLHKVGIRKLRCTISSMKHLRYLHINCLESQVLPESLCQLYNLQSLELANCIDLAELPGSIGNLVNLRYLSIRRGWQVRKLPESLCHLYNLHTLNLESCERMDELPSGVGNLVNLRYLSIKGGMRIRKLPESLCHLYNLHTLDLKGCDSMEELPSGIGELTNLRHLSLPPGLPKPLGANF